ncbi:hypothetical protein E2562_003842 [Oryza meyeriana var. granulata]|uniref:Uncharacterized protein n=1 Tax=Oryza meyeriana var. granulata TaxID=110450 RepID=A0A6G1CYP7_9ORYZ|nr:hypothetical protein E2562_003842 [Oryza meyeriana var. granulata]
MQRFYGLSSPRSSPTTSAVAHSPSRGSEVDRSSLSIASGLTVCSRYGARIPWWRRGPTRWAKGGGVRDLGGGRAVLDIAVLDLGEVVDAVRLALGCGIVRWLGLVGAVLPASTPRRFSPRSRSA